MWMTWVITVGQEMGARRSKKKKEEAVDAAVEGPTPRKGKGDRFRARKAREAARKAKSQAKWLQSKKSKKPFIPEQPDADVTSAFEKELATSALLPVSEKSQKKEVESQNGGGGGVPTHESQ